MAGRHSKPDTALQKNYSFTAVDDFDTRMYILEYIADGEPVTDLGQRLLS